MDRFAAVAKTRLDHCQAPPHAWKRNFLVPGPSPYLMAHSVGCLPVAADQAIRDAYLQPWAECGGDVWPAWLARIDAFRDALAVMLGGDRAEFCPKPNLSAGMFSLLAALPAPVQNRNAWLISEDAFPSLAYVIVGAHRLGYELRVIPRAQSPSDLDAWADAITPDVCGVLATHVHSNTGSVAPIEALATLCRDRDVFCVIDIAQSAGVLPIDLRRIDADAVLGSCIKWLCGGPGAGFLWINSRRLRQLDPIDIGWFSHADPFEFDIHHYRHADDALRFWGGTPSVAPYVLAEAGLQLLQRIGIDTIRRHNLDMIDAFASALPERWQSRMPAMPMGGTVCMPTDGEGDRIAAALKAIGARFDRRQQIVRLSFHLWNSADEATAVAAAWPR
jgi:kynureninase